MYFWPNRAVEILVFYQVFSASAYVEDAFDEADVHSVGELFDAVHALELNEHNDRLSTKPPRLPFLLHLLKHLNGLPIQTFYFVTIVLTETCGSFL